MKNATFNSTGEFKRLTGQRTHLNAIYKRTGSVSTRSFWDGDDELKTAVRDMSGDPTAQDKATRRWMTTTGHRQELCDLSAVHSDFSTLQARNLSVSFLALAMSVTTTAIGFMMAMM